MTEIPRQTESKDLASRVRLYRQVDDRPVVVVEGRPDKRLIETVLNGDVAIFVGGGREEVLRVAERFKEWSFERAVCVVDRDFDDVVAELTGAGLPIVAYDGADLEDMLLDSPAARRVVEELANAEKLAAQGVEKIMWTAREQTTPIARLRRGNATFGWGLPFDEIDLVKKTDKETLVINVAGVCRALRQKSGTTVGFAELERAAASGELPVCPRTARELTRGDDQLAVIGAALRRLIAGRPAAQADPDFLAGALRAAAEASWLRATAWFAEIESRLVA